MQRASISRQSWPLNANISLNFGDNPIPQTTIISQGLHKSEATVEAGEWPYWSQLDNTDNTADTLFFNPSFSVVGNQGASSSQTYKFVDSTGECYSRSIASANGALTAVQDDTQSHTKRLPSRWREFSFAFHQITAAIQPALALGDMLANWDQIAKGLAGAPRKRKSQEQLFSQTS